MAYRIPDCNLSVLQERIEKLARRAAKLGLTPPVLNITGYEDIPVVERETFDNYRYEVCTKTPKPGERILYHRRFHFVELTGEAPTLPGWDLLAVIEHTTDSEIGNVIRTVPGKECPVEYRTAGPLCQHCNSYRRRNETFVLLSATGQYKQVGRNCLADFCRSPEAAEHMVSAAEILASADRLCGLGEEEDGFGCRGRGRRFHAIEEVLACTSSFVRHVGWVSRAKARENAHIPGSPSATADLVNSALTRPEDFKKYASKEELAAFADTSEEHFTLAQAALEWIRAKREQAATLGDYLYNLLVVCSQEAIESKHFGLGCSLIAAYLREKDQLAKAAKQAASVHFGVIKRREIFTLTLESARGFDGNYGTRTLCKFKDRMGNVAIWWASAEVDMSIGQTYKIKGTVKAHSEFNGIKQTELSRCTVIE